MADQKINSSQANALVDELKRRYTTVNDFLKGDIQNLENVKELHERRHNIKIEKLQLLVESRAKRNLVKRILCSLLICLVAAALIVYAGIFDFGKLFPPMTDLASAIHASKHNNMVFDWILPITITTMILFVVNIIVLGLVVYPIAKIVDAGLANVHHEAQSAEATRQIIHELNANIVHLDTQHNGLNKILDGMILTAQKNNDQNAVDSILKLKDDLLSHATSYHRYYSIVLMRISM